MGMTIIGTRQIAIDRARNENLNSTFSSLMALNGITTLIAVVSLLVMTFTVKDFIENQQMFFFGLIKVISNFFLLEWFYKGLEEFRYITIRTIIVKAFYIASVFIFVRDADNYNIYYLLTVLMVTVNSFINTGYSRKYARFNIKLISIRSLIKPYFQYGLYFILGSLYTTFNIVYLGFTSDDTQVGYYTTATKLYTILLAFFTGITTVLMPRMSHLLAENKIEEFKIFINKSIKFLFSFSIPLVIFTIIYAPYVIYMISGPGYEGATTPMRIIMPLMIIIGYEQIQVIQCLMPLKKDKSVLINASMGALVGIILNILIVPHLQSVGSAITWFMAECTILFLSQIILTRQFQIFFPWKSFYTSLLSYVPLFIFLLIPYSFPNYLGVWEELIIGGLITIVYFAIIEGLILKNPLLLSIFTKFNSLLRN